MPSQPIFFRKNYADISYPEVVATASNSPDTAQYALNRSNGSAWVTTSSTDAENTTFEVDWENARSVTDIILVKHNFKSFTIEYWDGAAYQAFTPAISPTTTAIDVSSFQVAAVATKKIRITIHSTQVVDAQKYLYQFIATTRLGQFTGWPIIKPKVSQNLKTTRMLSGKLSVTQNVGYTAFEMGVSNWAIQEDITLIEKLYFWVESFLVWPGGGNSSQFRIASKPFRTEDIYLMRMTGDYQPARASGLYQAGLNIKVNFEEVAE